jgi:hypothetical protein
MTRVAQYWRNQKEEAQKTVLKKDLYQFLSRAIYSNLWKDSLIEVVRKIVGTPKGGRGKTSCQ